MFLKAGFLFVFFPSAGFQHRAAGKHNQSQRLSYIKFGEESFSGSLRPSGRRAALLSVKNGGKKLKQLLHSHDSE